MEEIYVYHPVYGNGPSPPLAAPLGSPTAGLVRPLTAPLRSPIADLAPNH